MALQKRIWFLKMDLMVKSYGPIYGPRGFKKSLIARRHEGFMNSGPLILKEGTTSIQKHTLQGRESSKMTKKCHSENMPPQGSTLGGKRKKISTFFKVPKAGKQLLE